MISFAERIHPANQIWAYLYDTLCIFAGSFFIALLSQIEIPLGFTPVPLTLQTFAVLLVGAFLGSKRGSLSVSTYLAQGLASLPVFCGGSLGFAKLAGPTGGYLIGFIFAAYLVGYLLERGWRMSIGKTLASFALGAMAILLCGAFWLSCFVGLKSAVLLGIIPFLAGDALKVLAAACLVRAGWRKAA